MYRARLDAFDIQDWPVAQQIDWHLVRAEMNGLEFDHRVRRPWEFTLISTSSPRARR